MPQLIVRNLPGDVVRALKVRAAKHGRSAEAEHRRILEEAVLPNKSGKTIKEILLDIPGVGEDSDFARPKDKGRRVRL